MKIDISKLEKAQVLKALYDNSRPLGMGFLHFNPAPMPIETARDLVKDQSYFDYVQGRVLKSDLGRDLYESGLYDRDNGAGAALDAIQPLLDSISA